MANKSTKFSYLITSTSKETCRSGRPTRQWRTGIAFRPLHWTYPNSSKLSPCRRRPCAIGLMLRNVADNLPMCCAGLNGPGWGGWPWGRGRGRRITVTKEAHYSKWSQVDMLWIIGAFEWGGTLVKKYLFGIISSSTHLGDGVTKREILGQDNWTRLSD